MSARVRRLVGSRPRGSNPAMQLGWTGVLRVLSHDEKRAAEKEWDSRVKQGSFPETVEREET